MSIIRKIITPIFWIVSALWLFYILQKYFAYNYYYAEQWRMFLFSTEYVTSLLSQPMGAIECIASFVIQYFTIPYIGAFCTVALYVYITWALYSLLHQTNTHKWEHPLLYLLPGFTFIWADFNEAYHFEEGIAFAFTLTLLIIYLRIKNSKQRILFAYLFSWIGYWLVGPMTFLFPIIILIKEILHTKNNWEIVFPLLLPFWCIIPPTIWYLEGKSSIPLHQLMTVSAYYHPLLTPPFLLWIAPCWTIGAVIINAFLGRIKESSKKIIRDIIKVIEIAIVFIVFWRGCNFYYQPNEYLVKKLDYYASTKQWDNILKETSIHPSNNSLLVCYQNLALAQTGRLANHLFDVKQCGFSGLWPQWNRMSPISGLMSRIAFSMGNVAMAQALAFEGIMGSERACNPRFMLILAKTSIIYGQYAVAEKYISLLERTACYRQDAKHLRTFLYNDKKILNDNEMGILRQSIQKVKGLTNENRAIIDIWPIVQSKSTYKSAAEYYGAWCLLAKDLKHFEELATLWRTTYTEEDLPLPFQQALLLNHEKEDRASLQNLGISQTTITNFERYKKALHAYVVNPEKKSTIQQYFGNTYWFYFTFYKFEQ